MGLIMNQADREELIRLIDFALEDGIALSGQGLIGMFEAFLRRHGYIRTDRIIGLKEASELTGTPLSTLASRTWRGTPGWPAPVRVVASGPLFDADAVAAANVDPLGRVARSRNGRTVTA